MPMQFTIPPDLEALVQKRLAGGAYANAEDVIRHALEAQEALSAHIEEGFLQAERGELIDGDQARQEIQAMKDQWSQERSVHEQVCSHPLTKADISTSGPISRKTAWMPRAAWNRRSTMLVRSWPRPLCGHNPRRLHEADAPFLDARVLPQLHHRLPAGQETT